MSAMSLVLIILIYLGILFGIASWAESASKVAKKLTSSASVYVLSLAIFCTSWTFYGSVGMASQTGILTFAIYLGPTLFMLVIWPLMQRVIIIKQVYRISSIADFLSARFNRSLYVAGLVTLVAMIGVVPYLALQLKAINASIDLMIDGVGQMNTEGVSWLVLIGVALFTIVFGVRHLDPTERHPGMMLALAIEGVVKLLAIVIVGIFVCFFMFDSPQEIFSQLEEKLPQQALTMATPPALVTWCSFLLLSGSAFMLLPRQFHVMVVENSNPDFVRKVQWWIPCYLFLMTLFVLPIAAAGLLLVGPDAADGFVLALPILAKQNWLAVLVFIGGFSAAMAMLMVSGMALATMFSNHLILPLLQFLNPKSILKRYLLQFRWLAVCLTLGAGQMFYLYLGNSYMLVSMGMISFCAILQFLPLLISGLYWREVNSAGAIAGLLAGFAIWGYCLVLPSLMHSGWLNDQMLVSGPWGISWLHPEHLFGTELDNISHGAFWSILCNVSAIVIVSLFWRPSKEEQRYSGEFIDVMERREVSAELEHFSLPPHILIENKRAILETIFRQYLPQDKASKKVVRCISDAGLEAFEKINVQQLADLEKTAERLLSGITGSAMAHMLIKQSALYTEEESEVLEQYYNQLLVELKVTPVQLRQQLNYAVEKELLAKRYTEQLQSLVDKRTHELSQTLEQLKQAQSLLVEKEKQASLGSLVAGVAHEINTPLGVSVTAASHLNSEIEHMVSLFESGELGEDEFASFIVNSRESAAVILKNNQRASTMVQSFKLIAIDQSNSELEDCSIAQCLDDVVATQSMVLSGHKHEIEINCASDIHCVTYPKVLEQVLTNLIVNSLLHAFNDSDSGLMRISASAKGNGVELIYQDNGKGMGQVEIKKLFDPFYTTKRHEGNVGLGAHLIYSLVTLKLEGDIEVSGEMGKGLKYKICFPSLSV